MKITLVFLALAFLLLVLPLTSASIIDQYNDSATASGAVTSTDWRGQTFTPSKSGLVSNVSFQLYRTSGINGTLIVSIRAVNATGYPIGADLSNGTVDTSTIMFNPGSVTLVNFTTIALSSFTVQQSVQYAFILRLDTSDVEWNSVNPGTYAGGNRITSSDSGGNWTQQTGIDVPFILNGNVVTPVVVNLVSPANASSLGSTNVSFSATLTPGTGFRLLNATLFVWNGTALFNRTTNVVNGTSINSTSWALQNFAPGSYSWNVFGCAVNISTNCSFAATNYTFMILPFSLVNSTFNASVYETSRQLFQINFTTFPNILTANANLIYNGSLYQGTTSCTTSGLCGSTVRLDIPLITLSTETKNLFWSVTTFDGSTSVNSNLTPQTQQVVRTFLEICDATYTTRALNFTAYDEQNNTIVSPFLFQATFMHWLGSGTVKRNTSFNLLNTTEVDLCIQPGNVTFKADADIEYNNVANSTLYNTRNYYLENASLTNNTNNIPLYLLKSVSSTSFILSVVDQDSRAVEGVLIYIQRYYPGTNIYNTVQIARTDTNGKSIGFFETETVEYKFILVKDGVVLLNTDKRKIFPESSPFTINFRVGSSLGNIFSPYQNQSNLFYTLDYNETLQMVTYTYIDTSGTTNYGRLLVQLNNPSSGMQTICDINSTQISATLECNVTGYSGNIIAKGYISRSPEVLVGLINFVTEIARDIFSTLGLVMAFIIVLAVALITVNNPIVQIVSVDFTILALSMIGLVTLSPIFIFGIISISTIIIVVLRI